MIDDAPESQGCVFLVQAELYNFVFQSFTRNVNKTISTTSMPKCDFLSTFEQDCIISVTNANYSKKFLNSFLMGV